MTKKWFWLLFSLILLLAIFVRVYKLGLIPVSLYWDETAMLVDAKTLAQTGHDMHGRVWYQVIFPSYGDYKLPVYIWLAAISVKLFGVSEWALRLPSVLAGVGTILVGGWLAKQLVKEKVSLKQADLLQLSVMFVLATSVWDILFSRTGFEGHLAQFFLAVSMVPLVSPIKSYWKYVLSAILGAVATYTYFSVRFVWPVVFLLVYLWTQSSVWIEWFRNGECKTRWRQWLKCILWPMMALAIFSLCLYPMFHSPLYEASNQYRLSTSSVLTQDFAVNSNQDRQLAGNTPLDRIVFHRYVLFGQQLAQQLTDHLSPQFLFLSGDANLRHGTGQHGLFLVVFLPFLLIGLLSLFSFQPILWLLLVGWWLTALLPASIPTDTPHALRSLNALVPVSFIIGFGLYRFLWWLSSRSKKILIGIGTLVLFGFTLSFGEFWYYYLHYYQYESAYSWQDSYKQLADVVLTHHHEVRTVWITPFEDRFYLWLLAYGPYTGSEIQALPKVGYQVKEVENVVFDAFDWDKLNTLDHKVMIVETPDAFYSHLESAPYPPIWTQMVSSADGINRFMVAEFEPPL